MVGKSTAEALLTRTTRGANQASQPLELTNYTCPVEGLNLHAINVYALESSAL